MSRGSNKPCPGCGKIEYRRPAKEVCTDCKYLLRRAAWLEDQLSKPGNDEVIVYFGEKSHWNEFIYTRSSTGRNLMDIFLRVAMAGSRPATTYNSEFNLLGKVEYAGGYYAVMSRPLAEAIRDLRKAIGNALELEYEAGKKDGHNLLARLASGDLSMNEFDKATNRSLRNDNNK